MMVAPSAEKQASSPSWGFRIFAFVYGLYNYALFMLLLLIDGSLFRTPTNKAKHELAKARHTIWDLSNSTLGQHKFHTLQSGMKLHYVMSGHRRDSATADLNVKNLVIFVHGYPNSWYLWAEYLRNPDLSRNAVLVAVDLPGFGGSDGLERYDATNMMETISEFILDMRHQYIRPETDGKLVLVTHDWGAIIGYKMGIDAPQAIDRLMIVNCVNPDHVRTMLTDRLTAAKNMMRTWSKKYPTSLSNIASSFRLLRKAFVTIAPVLRQLSSSGYIFAFNLPSPMTNSISTIGHFWWYRLLCSLELRKKHSVNLEDPTAAHSVASCLGPSPDELDTQTPDGTEGYGPDIRARAERLDGGYPERIRVYREGLAIGTWEKSIPTMMALQDLERAGEHTTRKRRASISSRTLFDQLKGAVRVPTTVVWGEKDIAMDRRICLDGIGNYLCKNSQVVLVPKEAHWLPVGKDGRPILTACIRWAVEGEKEQFRDCLKDEMGGWKVLLEK